MRFLLFLQAPYLITMLAAIKKLFVKEPVSELSPKEFEQKINSKDKKVIIDVRSKHEFDEQKIPNALNIDIFNPNFESRVRNLDPHKKYLVYCQSGKRSARACRLMKSIGMTDVHSLKGGLNNYEGRTL